MKFLVFVSWSGTLPPRTEDVGRQGWRKRNAMIWLSRERREGMKTLRHHAQDATFHHVRYFLCCCNAQNTEKNGCNPVCTVSRSKIEFGNFKVSIGSAVDYETFPGQEYKCTEKPMETYLCEKLIFWGKLWLTWRHWPWGTAQLTWFSNVDPFSRNSYKIS